MYDLIFANLLNGIYDLMDMILGNKQDKDTKIQELISPEEYQIRLNKKIAQGIYNAKHGTKE